MTIDTLAKRPLEGSVLTMVYFIDVGCIDVLDRSCVETCPVDCIYEGGRKLYINPAECIDCGACADVCPQDAVKSDRLLTPAETISLDDNKRFFEITLEGRTEPLSTPGGASLIGPIGVDTQLVVSHAVEL